MIKQPWKRRVKIHLQDSTLEVFIQTLLSGHKSWTYDSLFQHLEIHLHIGDLPNLQMRLFEWLGRRTGDIHE